MDKLNFVLNEGFSSAVTATESSPQEARKFLLQLCMRSLAHALRCRNQNCQVPRCQQIKKLFGHARNCKRKISGGCPICKQIIGLCCYHANYCQEIRCSLPFCCNIKEQWRRTQLRQRLQATLLSRRKVASMITEPCEN